MAKKQQIDAAFQSIVSGGHKTQPRAKKPKPLGVLLDQVDIDHLDQAAADLGVSRHALLVYAVRSFLARYDKGERPEKTEKTVTVLKVD